MAAVTTGNIPRLLQEGINTIFGDTYDEFATEWDKAFDDGSSSKAFELDTQVEGLGLAEVKDENSDVAFDDFAQGFTPKYINLTYALGFIMTEEALEDQLYDQGLGKSRSLAFSMSSTKEVVAANILNRASNDNFTMPGGDGLGLLSAVHVNGPSGGTYSNELAVTADLSEASLEDIMIQIGKATDPRGINIALQGVRVIVPVDSMFEAQRITGSVLRSGTAENDTNAIRDLNVLPGGFEVMHRITDTNAWFVKTNAPRGLRYFTRRARQIREDNAFSTGNARVKADERYSFGWSDPRGIYGSMGSS